jgi:cell division septum initiation protein DivIVA
VNSAEQDATRSREEHYQDVSLRAVELLAKAQRAADEAVAEAQSYARDLEESAREQYKQILQRAQTAAQQVASAEGEVYGTEQVAGGGEATSALDAQQLVYVRTYARVAHAQLKSVLAALNDELDQLAAMAEGAVPGPGTQATPPPAREEPGPASPPDQAQEQVMDAPSRRGAKGRPDRGADTANAPGSEGGGSPSDASWPPIFAATNAVSYVHRGSAWEGPQF